ncbi:unnamed protein product [Prorocentrum cordatum]|uniref:C2H2-type domain-containing protein n=1 Tax=Prorocentrum cordatum TaxID=2364126 RepID=A0ABN9S5L0_9DINO|nr:unnamed protein product [Polarella glacialis]
MCRRRMCCQQVRMPACNSLRTPGDHRTVPDMDASPASEEQGQRSGAGAASTSASEAAAGAEVAVQVRSAFGVVRAVSLRGLAELVLGEACRLPSARDASEEPVGAVGQHFADARVTPGGVVRLVARWRLEAWAAEGLLLCPTCGRLARGEQGLWMHQRRAHGAAYALARGTAAEALRHVALVLHRPAAAGAPAPARAAAPRRAPRRLGARLCPGMEAARDGDLHRLRALVADGWDPASRDRNGCPTLLWAAGGGHLEVCRYLAEDCGIDARTTSETSTRGYAGRTALHWAARNGRLEVIRWLVEEQGVQADALTRDGTSAFCWAAWQGHLGCLQWLAAHGCDVHSTNSYGCNAALWAAQGPGGVEICSFLFSQSCDFAQINANGHSALHKAAQRGKHEVCRWLLRGGGGLTPRHAAPDEEGQRPSDLAAAEGHQSLAAWLRTIAVGVGSQCALIHDVEAPRRVFDARCGAGLLIAEAVAWLVNSNAMCRSQAARRLASNIRQT